MTSTPDTDNLKSFDAYSDTNGQNMGQDKPTDVARPADLQRRLASDPGGEAETARLASGRRSEGADAATEAETPPEAIARISDPRIIPDRKGDASDAIERATSSLGEED